MSLPSGPHQLAQAVTGDPLEILSSVPTAAQLLLRDHIAGLEAAAGSARAEAARLDRLRLAEIGRLRSQLANAQAERDRAIEERDAALSGWLAILRRGRRWARR
jgi:hypothetical protein